MNETEVLKEKEPVGEPTKDAPKELQQEAPKTPETPKEPTIKKFYKACGLIQIISIVGIIVIPLLNIVLTKLVIII